jgi:hypothetical protein
MTREGRDLEGLVVRGSDHLTAYNLYADAFRVAASGASGVAPTRHEDYLDVIAVVEENLARRRQRS